MLYPEFKELISYESPSKGLFKYLKNKNVGDLSGNYLSSFRGQGMEFDEFREYSYGDDVRAIDWRVSARLDDTYIKLFKEERQRNVLLAVDCNDYMNFGTRGTFKNVMAARVASLLGFAANKNSDRIGFYLFGNRKNRFNYYKPVDSKSSLLRGLKDLCTEQDHGKNYSLDGAIFNLRRMNVNPNIVFIISDFRNVDSNFERNLFLLGRSTEIVFVNISDDSDIEIPDVGKIFLEFKNRRFLLNTSAGKNMQAYRENFEKKQAMLKNIATKMKAKIININTKDDFVRELMLGLRK